MSSTDPADLLKLARIHAPAFDDEQTRLFHKMPIKDRVELLFRMQLSTNAILRKIQQIAEQGK